MAKSLVIALVCLGVGFVFISAACAFYSDKPVTLNKETIVKSRAPLFSETYSITEGEMAASPFLTKPAEAIK